MKLIRKITALTLMLMVGFAIQVQAQSLPEAGSIGIRANIGGQSTIEMPYMLNENLSLAPYLGFIIIGDTNDNSNDGSQSFSFGVMPRFYLSEVSSSGLATYATGNLGLNISSSNIPNTDSNVNFNVGAGYGAEFFFSDSFSLSADVNLNLRAGDSRTNIGTGARVAASIYF